MAADRRLLAVLASPIPYSDQAVGVVAVFAGELQGALDSRVVIEQAKGVLVGRHGLTTRQAFERLRRQARDQRRPLTEVARGVVSAAEHR